MLFGNSGNTIIFFNQKVSANGKIINNIASMCCYILPKEYTPYTPVRLHTITEQCSACTPTTLITSGVYSDQLTTGSGNHVVVREPLSQSQTLSLPRSSSTSVHGSSTSTSDNDHSTFSYNYISNASSSSSDLPTITNPYVTDTTSKTGPYIASSSTGSGPYVEVGPSTISSASCSDNTPQPTPSGNCANSVSCDYIDGPLNIPYPCFKNVIYRPSEYYEKLVVTEFYEYPAGMNTTSLTLLYQDSKTEYTWVNPMRQR